MTDLERQIKAFILKALLAAKGEPMTSDAIVAAITVAFSHVTFTAADLLGHIRACQASGWITESADDLLGQVWTLTVKGKARAEQLR